MNPDFEKEIQRVFEAVVDQPLAERERLLAAACRGDSALRRAVERLLEHDLDTDPFPNVHFPSTLMLTGGRNRFVAGCRIGPYRVVRRIGVGGTSTVYHAERGAAELRQAVAIKVLHPILSHTEVARRFRTERRILASLSHPNVARLLDAGATADGIPYLVLEFVEGTPITHFCDDRRWSVERRLELFRKVCAAVAEAHRNLVVHRDLKPANVLVSEDGEPKVLDFGIAKLLEPDPSWDVVQTATFQRLLTPSYASPEQLAGEPITTASDVYSLGVLLFELLTGKVPFDRRGFLPFRPRADRLDDEPPPPSSSLADAAAARRRSSRRSLRRRLLGDVDVIVLRALEQDPARRYGSVEQLSEDVRRHLEGLPVKADSGSISRRNRAGR